jgi:hypothetical protein
LIDTVVDSVSTLRALHGAVLQSLPPAPPPLRRALRLGRRAGMAAQRTAWYSALAALALLTPPGRAASTAQPSMSPANPNAAADDDSNAVWLLVVLAVLGAQMAQRRERGTFTA